MQEEGAGGQQGFTIGVQYIPYHNHARGFRQQLCRDLPLCEGDTARVCLAGDTIGRIEKLRRP